MEINRAAPATASGETFIHADSETVFAVISAIDEWPTWNPDVKRVTVDGPVEAGTEFSWKVGSSSLRSRLEVVEPPDEIAWTGTTMGIRAIHVFRFASRDGGTRVSSEESWDGLIARLLKGWSRKTLSSGIDDMLTHLKTESERRAS